MLTVLEGLYIHISKLVPLSWTWAAVRGKIPQVFTKLAIEASNSDAVDALADFAKTESDHVRKTTKHKTWEAPWPARVADMVKTLRNSWETGSACSDKIMKLFLEHFDTPMPESKGVAFLEKYYDEHWREARPRCGNNCYFMCPYNITFSNAGMDRWGIELNEMRDQVEIILRAIYFQGGALFGIKLTFLHAMFARRNTGLEPFLIRDGGKGKGTDYDIDSAIVGEGNHTTLDVSCLMDRKEFRKSAGEAWDHAVVRTNEGPPSPRIEGDIWKRLVVGELVDLRVNYGFTVKRSYGISYLSWDCNPTSLPVIERSGGGLDMKILNQLIRRILALLYNRVGFTTNPNEVNHEKGIFMMILPDLLKRVIAHPLFRILFMTEWAIPYFREPTVDESIQKLHSLESWCPEIAQDTRWLAGMLGGAFQEMPRAIKEESAVSPADELLRLAHRKTPSKDTVKGYLIRGIRDFPGAADSVKNKVTKLHNFTQAIADSTISLFKPMQETVWERAVLDVDRMEKLVSELGGASAFGTWSMWGDVFQLRREQADWSPDGEWIDPFVLFDEEVSSVVAAQGPDPQTITVYELTNQRKLQRRAHAWLDGDSYPRRVSYLSRVDSYGEQYGADHWEVAVIHRRVLPYQRMIAMGPSIQKQPRGGRDNGLSDFCANADAPACHLHLLVRRLKNMMIYDEELHGIIPLAADNNKSWRELLERYFLLGEGESKAGLIKPTYGSRPACDIPFLKKLASAIPWANAHYKERKNPIFSRLCAMLSGDETDMTMDFASRIARFKIKGIRCLMFDEAYVQCDSPNDEALTEYAAQETRSNFGMEMQVKSWPRRLAHVQTLATVLLCSGKARVLPRAVQIPQGRGACPAHETLFKIVSRFPEIRIFIDTIRFLSACN